MSGACAERVGGPHRVYRASVEIEAGLIVITVYIHICILCMINDDFIINHS